MEVIIAVMILSVVMVALLQIKTENIFLISKTNERVKLNEYVQLSIDLKKECGETIGFLKRNLWEMIKFYLQYENNVILQQFVAEFSHFDFL